MPSNVVLTRSQKLSPLFKLRNLILDSTRSREKYFLGRVLTIVDAVAKDEEQRKSLKDLVHDAFYSKQFYDHEIREFLLQFAEKYCQEQSPKTNEDKDAFMCRLSVPKGEPLPNADYFAD